MNLLFLIIGIHFLAGGLGIFFINRRLDHYKKKQNWLKYVVYLVIFLIVLISVLVNKNVFLFFVIILLSVSLLEVLRMGKQPSFNPYANRYKLISVISFSVITFFFAVFVLLPAPLIAYTYTLVVIFDGASQISGQIAGKSKILPRISPDKTWAGLMGGFLSVTVTSVLLRGLASFSIWHSLFFSLLVCFGSFSGDMAASAYKRAFNSKDFGNIFPGQGGMLDRFDSFLVSGAIVGIAGLIACYPVNQIDRNIAFYLAYSLSYIVILLLGEMIQLFFRLRADYSRMFSHVCAGILSLSLIKLFTSGWYIIAICLQSAAFMFITKYMKLFGSHHGVKRKTYGSSLFFVGLIAAYCIYLINGQISVFIIAVAVLTVSDPVASLTGMNFKSAHWPHLLSWEGETKTIAGSLGFLVSSSIIIFTGISLCYSVSTGRLIAITLIISVVTTIMEAISPKGTDNLTIPLVTGLLLSFIRG